MGVLSPLAEEPSPRPSPGLPGEGERGDGCLSERARTFRKALRENGLAFHARRPSLMASHFAPALWAAQAWPRRIFWIWWREETGVDESFFGGVGGLPSCRSS